MKILLSLLAAVVGLIYVKRDKVAETLDKAGKKLYQKADEIRKNKK